MKAVGNRAQLSAQVADLFTTYAGALADEGLLVTAAKYARYAQQKISVKLCTHVGSLANTIAFLLRPKVAIRKPLKYCVIVSIAVEQVSSVCKYWAKHLHFRSR